jgi:MFS family permease
MQTVAAGWLIFDLTGNATAVGVLTFLSRGPGMLLSAYGGELADRYERRRLVILLYVCQAVPAALLALVAWEDISRVTEVYAATFMIGVAGALASPSMQQLVVATVPAELGKRATGLGSVSYNTARLIGPAVGGGLVAAIGPGPCFAINVSPTSPSSSWWRHCRRRQARRRGGTRGSGPLCHRPGSTRSCAA